MFWRFSRRRKEINRVHPIADGASICGPSTMSKEHLLPKLMRRFAAKGGVNHDVTFFDAGADSLLASQLLVRIELEFGKRLSMIDLFNASSARAVAAKLATVPSNPPPGAAVAEPVSPNTLVWSGSTSCGLQRSV